MSYTELDLNGFVTFCQSRNMSLAAVEPVSNNGM